MRKRDNLQEGKEVLIKYFKDIAEITKVNKDGTVWVQLKINHKTGEKFSEHICIPVRWVKKVYKSWERY